MLRSDYTVCTEGEVITPEAAKILVINYLKKK